MINQYVSNMEKLSRKVLPAGVAILSGIGAFAQGNDSVAVNEATAFKF